MLAPIFHLNTLVGWPNYRERLTSDDAIWEYARSNRFVIVTADSDFLWLATNRGGPPEVVRVENCNYKTAMIEDLLRRIAVRIAELERSPLTVLIIRTAS